MIAPRPRVLLVDDQREVVVGLQRVLSRVARGFDFDLVESGAEALARFEHHVYALVISDLRMPEMSGIELLERVAQRAPSVGRVLLSGTFDVEAATRALSTAHRFLCKPCNARTLAQTCADLHRLAPVVAATAVGAILALAIEAEAVARARAAVDRSALERAVGAHPALIAAVLHALGSQFLGTRAEPLTLADAITAIGHAGVDRVLNSGTLLVVEGPAGASIVEHAARARARAGAVVRADGGPTEALAAMLVDIARLGTADAQRWPGLRAGGGDDALLGLWGVAPTLIERVRAQSVAIGDCPA